MSARDRPALKKARKDPLTFPLPDIPPPSSFQLPHQSYNPNPSRSFSDRPYSPTLPQFQFHAVPMQSFRPSMIQTPHYGSTYIPPQQNQEPNGTRFGQPLRPPAIPQARPPPTYSIPPPTLPNFHPAFPPSNFQQSQPDPPPHRRTYDQSYERTQFQKHPQPYDHITPSVPPAARENNRRDNPPQHPSTRPADPTVSTVIQQRQPPKEKTTTQLSILEKPIINKFEHEIIEISSHDSDSGDSDSDDSDSDSSDDNDYTVLANRPIKNIPGRVRKSTGGIVSAGGGRSGQRMCNPSARYVGMTGEPESPPVEDFPIASRPFNFQTALSPGDKVFSRIDHDYKLWRKEELNHPPFGLGFAFPPTETGKFIKEHVNPRSTTSYDLFYLTNLLGVSPPLLWGKIFPAPAWYPSENTKVTSQPIILQCDPVLLLAMHAKLSVEEDSGPMDSLNKAMWAWTERSMEADPYKKRDLGMDLLARYGDVLVCFWLLFHLRYPKATGQPSYLDLEKAPKGFKKLYMTIVGNLRGMLDDVPAA